MVDTYRQAYKACEDLVKKESCGPILVRTSGPKDQDELVAITQSSVACI